MTDDAGSFTLTDKGSVSAKYVTAWKTDYYIGGCAVVREDPECVIQLRPVSRSDNGRYVWLSSLSATIPSGSKACRECHPDITGQWLTSTHASSATNPLFLAFFRGSAKDATQIAAPGYKLDFPNSNGNCATCHLPALALKNPFNSDPSKADGVEREGVFCDLCHKIEDARIDTSGGYPGIVSLRFNRPQEGHQLFYGSHDDVFPGDDSFHPLYKDSRYCAPCHNGKFWEVEIYSEYKEWAASDYASKKITCQNCHMAPNMAMERFATEKEGGIVRVPETISSHQFNGLSDHAFMRGAIDLDLQAVKENNHLIVTANVRNTRAGHHYPTGNPMRNMILLIDAIDTRERSLAMMSGERIPDWGGVGTAEDGNYAGLPGKGFAKILRDSIPYPANSGQRHLKAEYPASHWRPVLIESDNRIPAKGMDVSRYVYQIPADWHGPIRVQARLIYRRGYKTWMDAKGFAADDLELVRKVLVVER